jgi:hypothetical protein
VEGLLLNVRMVNAVFEDLNRPEIEAQEITQRFVERLPEYAAAGVRAISLNLQGGYPGYKEYPEAGDPARRKPVRNSAYEADGSLRPGYLARVQQVIEACDRLGVAVILGCYDLHQAAVLQDEAAVRNGVRQAARWVRGRGYTNVALEIANEFGQEGWAHECLRSPAGVAELVRLAQRAAPGLLVSASRQAELEVEAPAAAVWAASDFILAHMSRISLADYPARLASLKGYGKPVVVSEDHKLGAEGVWAAMACAAAGCSWGLTVREVNQYHPPFRFEGTKDAPGVYAELKRLAGG